MALALRERVFQVSPSDRNKAALFVLFRDKKTCAWRTWIDAGGFRKRYWLYGDREKSPSSGQPIKG